MRFYPSKDKEFEIWKKKHPILKILFFLLFGPIVIPIGIIIAGAYLVLYITAMCGQFLFPILGIAAFIQLFVEGNWAAGIFSLIISVYLGAMSYWIYEKIKYI
jgi:hypothetical protein